MFVRNIIIIFDKLQPMVFIYSYYIFLSAFIIGWLKTFLIGKKSLLVVSILYK